MNHVHVTSQELNSLPTGCLFCCLLIFFKINFFEKFFQEYDQNQTVWILIRPDVLSGRIWVQPVCKGYQQMIKIGQSQASNGPAHEIVVLITYIRKSLL